MSKLGTKYLKILERDGFLVSGKRYLMCIREIENEASFVTSLIFYTVEKSIKEKEICIYSRVAGLLSFD